MFNRGKIGKSKIEIRGLYHSSFIYLKYRLHWYLKYIEGILLADLNNII